MKAGGIWVNSTCPQVCARGVMMRAWTGRVCALVLALLPSDLLAQGGERPIEAPLGSGKEQITQLIQHLGSDSLQERERASQVLVRIGAPALDSLRRALKDLQPVPHDLAPAF
jgi:hypothetical protein